MPPAIRGRCFVGAIEPAVMGDDSGDMVDDGDGLKRADGGFGESGRRLFQFGGFDSFSTTRVELAMCGGEFCGQQPASAAVWGGSGSQAGSKAPHGGRSPRLDDPEDSDRARGLFVI